MEQVLPHVVPPWLSFLVVLSIGLAAVAVGSRVVRALACAWVLGPSEVAFACLPDGFPSLAPWLWLAFDALFLALCLWGLRRRSGDWTGPLTALAAISLLLDGFAAAIPGLAPWTQGSPDNPCRYLIGAVLVWATLTSPAAARAPAVARS